MRHRVSGRHLGRPTDERAALYRSLVTALLRYERIRTTEARAKAIRGQAERLITIAKHGLARANSLHERRQIIAATGDVKIAQKLFDLIGPKFAERPGGYTRVVRLGPRKGDAAEMVQIELVE